MICSIIKMLDIFSLNWSVDLADHISVTHTYLVKISIFSLFPLLPALGQIMLGIFDLRQAFLVMSSGSGAAGLHTETNEEDDRPDAGHDPGHPALGDGVHDVDVLVYDSIHLDPFPDPVQHQSK